MLEGDSLVFRYAKVDDTMTKNSFPAIISLSDDGYVFSYCVRNNTDVKINHADEYANYTTNPAFNNDTTEKTKYEKNRNHSAIYVRLIYKNKIIGIMTYQVNAPNAYSGIQFSAIKSIASFVSIAITNCQNRKIVDDKMVELEKLSNKDSLTGLGNRRAFNRCLQYNADWKDDFYLLFADMNHLKRINDLESHIVGDRYLLAVAEVLLECARGHDVFRISGDEFAIVLNDVNKAEVDDIVANIHKCCQKKQVGKHPLSLSIGSAHSKEAKSMEGLFAEAEAKMYSNKRDYYSAYADNI